MSQRNRAWIPNGLTLMRLVAGVVLPWTPGEWQFGLLVVAGFSDLIDGWISRRLGVTSGFGQMLDPIADKGLVLGTVIVALRAGWMSWFELLAFAARDLTVPVLGAIVLAHGRENWQKMTPRLSGKLATGAQIAALLALFWFRQPWPFLVCAAGALSVFSAADYSLHAYRSHVAFRAGGKR
jgi:cardiolipin synthase (CMP-forming)